MATRRFKRLGDALALLGTAYAASKVFEGKKTPNIKPKLKTTLKPKVGSSLLDNSGAGTNYDDSLMNLSNLDKTGAGTTYDNKSADKKPSIEDNVDGVLSTFGPMAKEGKFIKASKGTMVVAKTKIGRTKPTKLY